jgi:pyridoxine 5-phosphate synthase
MNTQLSVNLNKIALIRNSRDTTIPDVQAAARTCIENGAQGITVHPRPDQRHIRVSDVLELNQLLKRSYPTVEFNIEGNPFAPENTSGYPGFIALVEETLPQQCTLVPDDPSQLTSDHGWDLTTSSIKLEPIVRKLQSLNIRVSLFMDPVDHQIKAAADLGVERIEFYTGPFADAFDTPEQETVLSNFIQCGNLATTLGLEINAGHDLNLDNLDTFCSSVKNVSEVSIGHALITDALWLGLPETVTRYQQILNTVST